MIVGLTGVIGAGKTTVSKILATYGARVINADRVGREVVKPQSPAWESIVEYFGTDILREDETLDRRRLGNIVFEDPDRLELLDKITHPYITKVIKERLVGIEDEVGPEGVIVLDAPLLVETGLHRNTDYVVVVTAEPDLRLKRLMRQGLTKKEAEVRMRVQHGWPRRQLKIADYVMDNDGTIDELRAKVAQLWQKLSKLSRQRKASQG